MLHIESQLLDGLPNGFSICSAGRDGKKFYNALQPRNKQRVSAFFDVDEKKLKSGGYFDKELKRHVPVLHFSALRDSALDQLAAAYLPVIILVKGGLYPEFEENLASLKMEEGQDYWHFA